MQFNNAFFEELSVSEPVTALVVDAAERIAGIARETAPVDTGEYRNSIAVTVKRQKRSVALVVATDAKWAVIEAKTGNLVRALKAGRRRRG
jgi:hypothetical protein